jgi:protein SCO1/2
VNKLRIIVAGVLAVGLAAGCSTGGSSGKLAIVSPPQTGDGLRGDILTPPTVEPPITMTDTAGAAYDVEQQAGHRVTIMYFGYTHCPDICPTIMADLAEALRQSAPAVRSDVNVVFITVDPHRDTLPVLRGWLNHFSPSFVGLRAPIRQVIDVQRAADVPVSKVNSHSKHGYTVEHSAELLVFTPDHKAHVLYTDGPTTISDIRHDLPLIESNKAWT